MNDFLRAEPFPHLVMDGVLPSDVNRAAAAEFERVPCVNWVHYCGGDEAGKHACNDWDALKSCAPVCYGLLTFLTSPAAAAIAGALTGIEGLVADPLLYGGGLHLMDPGSHLGLHLDNELHPETGLVRRLNLIVYLRHCEFGRLELWDRLRQRAKRIDVRPGRMVLMRTDADSFHSVEMVRATYPDNLRKSVAVYFWSPARSRARFLPVAGEAPDAEIEAARRARSNPACASLNPEP